MSESTQHKLDRVRPPRVQITYDVETGDAIQKKELPFVVGVLADLAGSQEEPLPAMKHRKFVDIDRDNLNDVMAAIGPRLAIQVDNQLTDEDSKFNVELNFSSMDDFDPVSVVGQVPALKELFEARQRLTDLMAKLDGNDDLDKLLQEVMSESDKLTEIQTLAEAARAEEASDDPEG